MRLGSVGELSEVDRGEIVEPVKGACTYLLLVWPLSNSDGAMMHDKAI